MPVRPTEPEIHQLSESLFVWHRYDPGVKADLFSTGLRTAAGVFLIDPISINDDQLTALISNSDVAGIVVTNANHERAAHEMAPDFGAPIFAHSAAGIPHARPLENEPAQKLGFKAIVLEGGPAGEIALHCAAENGSLILGDAVINFGAHGFDLLPAKYCSNQKLLRKSLGQLLDLRFERMLFAHGTPLLAQPRARLAALLSQPE